MSRLGVIVVNLSSGEYNNNNKYIRLSTEFFMYIDIKISTYIYIYIRPKNVVHSVVYFIVWLVYSIGFVCLRDDRVGNIDLKNHTLLLYTIVTYNNNKTEKNIYCHFYIFNFLFQPTQIIFFLGIVLYFTFSCTEY